MKKLGKYRVVAWTSAFMFFVATLLMDFLADFIPEDENEMSPALAMGIVLLFLIGFISFVVFVVFIILTIVQRISINKKKADAPLMNTNDGRFCPHCGTPVDSNNRFCLNCGNRLVMDQPDISFLGGDDSKRDTMDGMVPSYESEEPAGLMDYYRAMFYGTTMSNVVIIGFSLLVLAVGIYMLVRGQVKDQSIGTLISSIVLILVAILIPLAVYLIVPLARSKQFKKSKTKQIIKIHEDMIVIESQSYDRESSVATKINIFLNSVSKAKENDKGYYFSFTNDKGVRIGLFIRKERDMSYDFKQGLSAFVGRVKENKKR